MMRALVTMLVLVGLTVMAADEPPLPEVATALSRIRDRSTIELTTTGRKSGKQHTRPVWFVVSDGKIVVQAGKDGKTDWYRNLQKSPSAVVRQGEYTFRVRAKPVDDPAQVEAVHKLVVEKYTTAWMLSFFGSSIGRGRPVELEPVSVAVGR